jgi:sigma-B regulation protein RsbU (phosphoserine phosphatase)
LPPICLNFRIHRFTWNSQVLYTACQIGIDFGTEHEKSEFVLSPTEAIIFIADGVTEAKNEKNELFGDKRLTEYFNEANGPPWAKGLLDRIDAWRGNAERNDDLPLMKSWRDPPR